MNPNKLSEREDDFIINVIYQPSRNVKDLCKVCVGEEVSLRNPNLKVSIGIYMQAKEELLQCFDCTIWLC